MLEDVDWWDADVGRWSWLALDGLGQVCGVEVGYKWSVLPPDRGRFFLRRQNGDR